MHFVGAKITVHSALACMVTAPLRNRISQDNRRSAVSRLNKFVKWHFEDVKYDWECDVVNPFERFVRWGHGWH